MQNNFGLVISALLERTGLDARTLADKIEVDPSTLSRIMAGERRSCNEKTLTAIVLRSSEDPNIKAELMAAYLRDQILPEVDTVVVSTKAGKKYPNKPQPAPKLAEVMDCYDSLAACLRESKADARIVEALKVLGTKAVNSQKVRKTLSDLSEVIK